MPIRTNLNQIPTRSLQFLLPSRGIPYKEKYPDVSQEVTIKPYTLEVEGILVGNRTSHEKMAMITSKVVTLPQGMSVNDLLVADQFVILALARALTYGEVYKWHATCPACRHREECVCKVPDELPVRVWDPDNLDLNIKLPVCKDSIGIRYLTVREDGDLDRFEKQLSIGTKGSQEDAATISYIRRLAYHIETVNNSVPDNIDETVEYIKRLFGEDVAAFKEGIESLGCGLEYEWKICCDKCQHIYSTQFPITSDFFRGNRR